MVAVVAFSLNVADVVSVLFLLKIYFVKDAKRFPGEQCGLVSDPAVTQKEKKK
jgi:hypothetical protein